MTARGLEALDALPGNKTLYAIARSDGDSVEYIDVNECWSRLTLPGKASKPLRGALAAFYDAAGIKPAMEVAKTQLQKHSHASRFYAIGGWPMTPGAAGVMALIVRPVLNGIDYFAMTGLWSNIGAAPIAKESLNAPAAAYISEKDLEYSVDRAVRLISRSTETRIYIMAGKEV